MLQLYKNQVVTSVSKQQVDIRKLELDWYTNNYWTLSQQAATDCSEGLAAAAAALITLESTYRDRARVFCRRFVIAATAAALVLLGPLLLCCYSYWSCAAAVTFVVTSGALLAGFAFAQITTTLPKETSLFLETLYLVLACSALGLQMCVVVTTTFCCIWGPGLALRGPEGLRSVHAAVDSLKAEHAYVFAFFFLGLLSFYLSSVVLVWCYFEDWIAYTASLFLLGFLVLTLYYTVMLTVRLRVHPKEAVEGKIRALQLYENISDLDESILQAAEASGERALTSATAVSAGTPTSAARAARAARDAAGAPVFEGGNSTAITAGFPGFFGSGEISQRRVGGFEATSPAAASARRAFGDFASSAPRERGPDGAVTTPATAAATARERQDIGGTALRPGSTQIGTGLDELRSLPAKMVKV